MILYFSGTGNSKHVAKKLETQLGDTALNLAYYIKNDIQKPIHSDKPWVIVVPTYGWQIPHIVANWILQTELTGCRDAYFVMTCGDDTGNAQKYNHILCEKKNWIHKGTATIVMPENYIALFDAPDLETSKRIVKAASRSIKKTGEYILQGGNLPKRKISLKDKIKSGPVNILFYRLYVKAKKFCTTESCTGCGLCESLCPMNNISVKNGTPIWGKNCTHCMACICGCPMEAIEYGKISEGKVRYTCPED
ncbi:MAG: EFR1 family ferrodoxin [Firmicutes bacterium]|nr:EFR1 family ferrodoxin [Bacillota bacterium]